jgi:5-methylcytosine-specific restriction endonuclease McrA
MATVVKRCSKCEQEKPATTEFFHRHRGGLTPRCRDCLKDGQRAHYAANRGTALQRQRVYDLAHAEERSLYQRQYRAAHKEESAERDRAYYEAHRDQALAGKRRYYLANCERIAEYQRDWQRANPDKTLAYGHNHRARKRGNGGTHTAADVAAQFARQGGRCFWCHEKLTIRHTDHVIPLALGGSNGKENIVVSCASCNCSKSDRHPMDFAGVMY